MTNIYAHISDGDAPKSQHVTEVSFVDENGKHVDIGGGGTGTLTEDNLEFKNNVTLSDVTPVGVCKNADGNLSLMIRKNKGLAKITLSGGITALAVPAIPSLAALSELDSSAELADVIRKVNEILSTVKTAN